VRPRSRSESAREALVQLQTVRPLERGSSCAPRHSTCCCLRGGKFGALRHGTQNRRTGSLHYTVSTKRGWTGGVTEGWGSDAMIASRRARAFAHQIDLLFDVGTIGDRTDGQLLERFATESGDAAETAFAALVARHGPMVLRTCRAILGDEDDAQDAF